MELDSKDPMVIRALLDGQDPHPCTHMELDRTIPKKFKYRAARKWGNGSACRLPHGEIVLNNARL